MSAVRPQANPRPYAKSERREETQRRNREQLLSAGWAVFSTVGIDGATARDIISLSGLSPGTFYNYFGTKEAVFEAVLQDLLLQIRAVTSEARARGYGMEEKLLLSYEALFQHVLSVDGGWRFFELNGRHVRDHLQRTESALSIIKDLTDDLTRELSCESVTPNELSMMAALIFANGAEALCLSSHTAKPDVQGLSRFMTRLMIHGIGSWTSHSAPPGR